MKIFAVIWNYWPGPQGGTERQCQRLTRELARRGHAVEIYTRWGKPGAPRKQLEESVVIRRLGWMAPCLTLAEYIRDRIRKNPSPEQRGQKSLPSSSESSASSTRRVRWMVPLLWLDKLSFMLELGFRLFVLRRRPDVFYVHESHWLLGFVQWLGEKVQVPVLCKEADYPALSHTGQQVPFLSRWLNTRSRAHFQVIIPAMREDLRRGGVSDDRIVDIPNSVNIPPRVSEVGQNEYAIFLANFGQGAQRKAFDILLEAWAKVASEIPSARLIMAGAGDTAVWRDYARTLGCERTVDFPGFVTALEPLFLKAALFVLPSRREGLSNALLEAQSYGIPAVVSDIPGNHAVIEEGRNGFVVPTGRADLLAEAMLKLYQDVGLRKRMGAEARKTVETRFAIDRVVDRIEEEFSHLIQARGKN